MSEVVTHAGVQDAAPSSPHVTGGSASPRQRHKRPEVVKSRVIKCCFIVRLIHDGAASNQNESGWRSPRPPRQTADSFFLALPAHRMREATCGVKESPVTRWGPRVRVTKSVAEGQRSPLVYLEEELSLGPPSASAGAALSKSSAFFFVSCAKWFLILFQN